ncbi:sensor histidine kinase [Bernardetia sp.]|uniref:sensor histidine kinase n=1 Tax=Bernardetia sp. TaxID=1937974 RepID=UPI0025B85A2A|nr:PAS domain S-box protein [Bernardetia sp.]
MKLKTVELLDQLVEIGKEIKNYQEILGRVKSIAKMGLWEVNLEKQTVFWSDITRQIHEAEDGYSPSVEEGINFYVEGESRDLIIKVFTRAVEKGENYDVEVEIRTAKGNRIWARAIGISEFKDGKCERVYGLFQDINESYIRRQELEQQKELFRQTFEYAPNGMALISLEGKWVQVNQQVCNMLGYTKEELAKLTFHDITHPEDLDLDLKLLEELMAGKRESYQMEKRYYDKYNHIVWVLLSVSMMKNKAGKPLHFVSQLTDITEKKLLLEKTLAQNERLLNFAHIVSHNLRSHTSNFSMLLSMMKMEHPDTAKNDYYPMLTQSSDKLQETLSYLNEIVVMQSEVKDNIEALNLYEYIEKVQVSIQSQVTSTNTDIINRVDKNHFVEAIPAYLESIILNFLTNSIKYRAEGRKANINIFSEEHPHFIAFSVKDNGLGIDLKRNGKKLFGMYKTFHDKEDSRGIGLFITKSQIEALGGRVEVESEVNQGTTFKIYLRNAKV